MASLLIDVGSLPYAADRRITSAGIDFDQYPSPRAVPSAIRHKSAGKLWAECARNFRGILAVRSQIRLAAAVECN
jgi:hypothetical protein